MDKIYLPDWVASSDLHKVRADWQDVYEDHPTKPGIKVLMRGARKVIEGGEAELAALKAEEARSAARDASKIAELESKLVRIQTESKNARTAAKNARIDNRLEQAFKARGVNVHLIRSGIALLRNEYEFDVVLGMGDDYSVTATVPATGYSTSAEYVVEDFLDSEEGAGFRAKPRTRSDGMFTGQLAALKSIH